MDFLQKYFFEHPSISIMLGTFISEDLTFIFCLTMYQTQKLATHNFLFSYVAGVLIGDYCLYGIGFFARKSRWLREKASKYNFIKQLQQRSGATEDIIDKILIYTRFIPGSRIPAYLTAGYISYSIYKFTLILGLAAFLYVLSGIFITQVAMQFFSQFDSLAFKLTVSVVAFFLTSVIFKIMSFFVQNKNDLKTAIKIKYLQLAKLKHPEFWPPLLFYFPLYLYFPILFMQYGIRSFLYANPGIKYSGLIGESKYEIEEQIKKYAPSLSLNSFLLLDKEVDLSLKKTLFCKNIESLKIEYPVVIKPNYGQKGRGVFLAHSEAEAIQYMNKQRYDMLVQEYCEYANEISIFYIRYPNEMSGQIFSSTHKIFPVITGDGVRTMGEIVLQHSTYKWQSSIYFERFKDHWGRVLDRGEKVQLVFSGNHAQGTVFKSGIHLVSDELKQKIDQISVAFKGFYIGRYDLRYESIDDLTTLRNIKIIELNGAGAESTDIYDCTYSYIKIVKILFKQWSHVFAVGRMNVEINKPKLNLGLFLVDLYKYLKLFKKYPISK